MLPKKPDYSTFGGSKVDYSEVVDPSTDRSADEVNKALATVAAMSRLSTLVSCTFTASSSPVVTACNSVTGNDVSLFPSIVHTGTGIYTLTFPATVNNNMNENVPYVFQAIESVIDNNLTDLVVPGIKADITGANTIQIRTIISGALNDTGHKLTVNIK